MERCDATVAQQWPRKQSTNPLTFLPFYFFALFYGITLRAEVTLPAIFGDHMVLQQGMTLPVWGKATPGEAISVSIAGRTGQTLAAPDGSWRVTLRPIPCADIPRTLLVQGKNQIEIHDVLVGDVWICAGEGNMEFPLSDATGGKDSQGEMSDHALRFFYTKNNEALGPDHQYPGHWVISTPLDSPNFSAVGYFFARDLRSVRHLPIGMIQCTTSASPAQAWMSHEGLSAPPSFSNYLAQSALRLGDHKTPSILFKQMIRPLIPYAMTGVIWYQGESNDGMDTLEYRRLFPRLIRDWRSQWRSGPFPFLFVQSAGFGDEQGALVESFKGANHQLRRGLPWLREGAACALTLPNTGMAIATDLGLSDDRQPPDKLDIGRRLALLARKGVYGEEIVDAGPTYHSMRIEGGKVRVSFKNSRSGLTLGTPHSQHNSFSPMLSTRLMGFALAGANEKWFPAGGLIEGQSVVLSSDAVPHPIAVRYNWKGFPNGNLYNKEGLPAAPFRTDTEQPEE